MQQRHLTRELTGCVLWREAFKFQRRYPTDTRDPKQVERRARELNDDWKGHDCEIEDLLPNGCMNFSNATLGRYQEVGGSNPLSSIHVTATVAPENCTTPP